MNYVRKEQPEKIDIFYQPQITKWWKKREREGVLILNLIKNTSNKTPTT